MLKDGTIAVARRGRESSRTNHDDVDGPLAREFYDRCVIAVARELLGCRLISALGGRRTEGLIVETEAYLAEGDPACHAARGRSPKNEAMFGPPGHAYVYAIHAKWCFNVVTQPAGVPSAVLIRALQPLRGLAHMRQRRGSISDQLLARGPARLCHAMGLDRGVNRHDLTLRRRLWIADCRDFAVDDCQIAATLRVGVTSAHDLPLRFVFQENPWASGPKRLALSGGRPNIRDPLRTAEPDGSSLLR